MHAVNAAPSSEHSNVEPLSVESNVNVAEVVLTEPVGPVRMFVSGGVVSTVQVRSAGVWSVFPAVSVAFTENVCGPSAKPL